MEEQNLARSVEMISSAECSLQNDSCLSQARSRVLYTDHAARTRYTHSGPATRGFAVLG
jgi:hypothetical protein